MIAIGGTEIIDDTHVLLLTVVFTQNLLRVSKQKDIVTWSLS